MIVSWLLYRGKRRWAAEVGRGGSCSATTFSCFSYTFQSLIVLSADDV
jgi:hypothetical protein